MKPVTVYTLVSFSTLFWGANFVLAGPVLADLPPLWAAALRFVLGTLLMFAITRARHQELLAPARAHTGVYLLVGSLGICAFNVLFFYALRTTSAVNAALIMATNPLLTTLLAALLLGERPNLRQLAGLPLALFGVTVVISGGQLHRLLGLHVDHGDLLMLGANLAWAFYNVSSRRYMPKRSSLTNTTLTMAAGALLLLVFAASSSAVPHMPGTKAMLALATMTVCGTVLAYLFWNTGIAALGAARTALFLNLVPVFAMLISIVTGTIPTLPQLVGGVLVISGISLSMLPRRQLAMKT